MNGASLPAEGCRAVIVGICAFAGLASVRSVLICDDRPTARQGLAELLRPLPSLCEIRCMADGFAVVDALAAAGADLVLIGVHPASDIGLEAIDLVLGMHPSTVVVVVGSVGDLDVLVPAYLRGSRGLLLWEPPGRSGTDQAGRRRRVAHRGLPRS
jgi:CheY-like chemotaxis protein